MPKHSPRVQQRLAGILHLLGTNHYSASELATTLGTSEQGIVSSIAELRRQGHKIGILRRRGPLKGWAYILLPPSESP